MKTCLECAIDGAELCTTHRPARIPLAVILAPSMFLGVIIGISVSVLIGRIG